MATTNTTTKKAPAARPARPGGFGGQGGRIGGGGANRPGGPGGRGGKRPDRQSFERARPEFEQKILSIRRVTRVVAGGRRMSFAVSMVIGDKKGSVGLGTGKAGDTSLAIAKAMRNARKNLIRLKLSKEFSLPHEVSAKYGSSRVMLRPNNGKGLVAGSSARDILILAGMKNVTSKYTSGTKNKLNNARAVMTAFKAVEQKGMKPQVAAVVSEVASTEEVKPEE